MDRTRLFEIFEKLDATLEAPAELHIRGGAAALALGLEGRTTVDIDVLPSSRFRDADLRRACEAAGLLYNPPGGKALAERDFVEIVPEETLVLPKPSAGLPYNTVFRGERLTVLTPPAADLVAGKLKRLEPEDLGDIAFLIQRFGLTGAGLEEAFSRLPERWRKDRVIEDNLRYVMEDL